MERVPPWGIHAATAAVALAIAVGGRLGLGWALALAAPEVAAVMALAALGRALTEGQRLWWWADLAAVGAAGAWVVAAIAWPVLASVVSIEAAGGWILLTLALRTPAPTKGGSP